MELATASAGRCDACFRRESGRAAEAGGGELPLSPRIETGPFTFTPRPPLFISFAAEDLTARGHDHGGGTTSEFLILQRRPLHPSPVPA
jgi:hypothetical protein